MRVVCSCYVTVSWAFNQKFLYKLTDWTIYSFIWIKIKCWCHVKIKKYIWKDIITCNRVLKNPHIFFFFSVFFFLFWKIVYNRNWTIRSKKQVKFVKIFTLKWKQITNNGMIQLLWINRCRKLLRRESMVTRGTGTSPCFISTRINYERTRSTKKKKIFLPPHIQNNPKF